MLTYEVEKKTKTWFFFILIYLIVDFIRPQDLAPIGAVRLGMLSMLVLLSYCLILGKFFFEIPQIRILWLFFVLLVIHIPLARNNFYAYQTAMAFLPMLVFVLSLVFCLNIKRLKIVVNLIILSMIYMAFFGLTHGGHGSGGYFTDENDLALFIIFVLPLCYFLIFVGHKIKWKIFYAFSTLIGLAAVIATMSRGGMVGLIAIGIGVWFFSNKKILSLLLIGFLTIFIFWIGEASYWQEMSTISDITESTAQARIQSWTTAWKMFLDNPFGVGGNNFQVRFPEYQTEWFKRGMWGRVSHSLWFTILSELGIPGCILYLGLSVKNFSDIAIIRRLPVEGSDDVIYLKALASAFTCSILGYFACGTFLSVLYYPYYWYLTGIIVATTRIGQEIVARQNDIINLRPSS